MNSDKISAFFFIMLLRYMKTKLTQRIWMSLKLGEEMLREWKRSGEEPWVVRKGAAIIEGCKGDRSESYDFYQGGERIV